MKLAERRSANSVDAQTARALAAMAADDLRPDARMLGEALTATPRREPAAAEPFSSVKLWRRAVLRNNCNWLLSATTSA